MNKKKILIIGGGFGGVYLARSLENLVNKGVVEVTLVSRNNYFLFTPLLAEVATGSLSPLSVAEPIRGIFRNSKIKFIQTEVTKIDLKKKKIKTKLGLLDYDILVVSSGAETDYHNVVGAEKHSLPLKNLIDAKVIRNQIIDRFEEAAHEPDIVKRRELLSFAVVGGGATGIELATELSEFIHHTMKGYYASTYCVDCETAVYLFSGNREILHRFPKELRLYAKKVLQAKSIILREGEQVTAISDSKINLIGGEQIPCRTVLWTAGVKPFFPHFSEEIKLTNDRILTNEFGQLINYPEVYCLGDVGTYLRSNESAPMSAQSAVSLARQIGQNIQKEILGKNLKPIIFKTKGDLVSLGRWQAIGKMGPVVIRGRLAWCLWRTVYLFKYISWSKKTKVAFEWTLNLFYPRDITKLS